MATPSLYRRYRPRRFGELKGQDHVVRALRDAVASGREGQAYLFSGPRGTGKTTSARILAKVLNCEQPDGGEPCCACESCLAVERGNSYDVHELDAASNNGVDAMRDLIEKASLGTPGRHKVYILDEVHMLSRAAEATLLKTLEEPPSHVVFVLATTDPQKVSETIRSRTQHLRFHLLPPDVLAEHVRWVADDAGLTLDQDALDAAIAQGGGSARDTLSALELIANAGGDTGAGLSLDEFVEAMIEHQPGRAITAMAHAISNGNDARGVAEQLVRHLRNGFLALMAPELVQLTTAQVDELAEQARRLGPAGLVRGIEVLGTTLVELRHAPDPRVLIEVALVKLTADEPPAADDVVALASRVAKLEQAVAAGAAAPAAAVAPAPRDAATGRAALGGRARRAADDTRGAPRPDSGEAGTAAQAGTAPPATTPAAPAPAGATTPPTSPATAGDAVAEWEHAVRPTLRGIVRALFTPIDVREATATTVTMAAPNATHRDKCEAHRATVEEAWRAATGRTVTIELTLGGGRDDTGRLPRPDPGHDDEPAPHRAAGRPAAPTPPPDDEEEAFDPDELVDAGPANAPSALDRLAEAFPGAEVVERSER